MKNNKIFLDEIKKRDGNKCFLCGNKIRLHIHHIIYKEMGGGENYKNLITLCEKCHREEHKKSKQEKYKEYTDGFFEPKNWKELVIDSGYLVKGYRLSNETIVMIDNLRDKEKLSYNLLFKKVFEQYERQTLWYIRTEIK